MHIFKKYKKLQNSKKNKSIDKFNYFLRLLRQNEILEKNDRKFMKTFYKKDYHKKLERNLKFKAKYDDIDSLLNQQDFAGTSENELEEKKFLLKHLKISKKTFLKKYVYFMLNRKGSFYQFIIKKFLQNKKKKIRKNFQDFLDKLKEINLISKEDNRVLSDKIFRKSEYDEEEKISYSLKKFI